MSTGLLPLVEGKLYCSKQLPAGANELTQVNSYGSDYKSMHIPKAGGRDLWTPKGSAAHLHNFPPLKAIVYLSHANANGIKYSKQRT